MHELLADRILADWLTDLVVVSHELVDAGDLVDHLAVVPNTKKIISHIGMMGKRVKLRKLIS